MTAGMRRALGVTLAVPAAVCIGLGLMVAGCAKDKGSATGEKPAAQTDKVNTTGPAVVENPDAVVVSVYGKKLTKGEVNEQIGRALASPQFQSMAPEMVEKARPKLGKDIADRFVTQCVLEHEAEVKAITVSDKERDEELTALKATLPGGMPLDQMLTMMGMEMSEFTNRITQELKIRKMLDVQASNVPPATAEEVLAFYSNSPASFQMPENARVRHVLIAFDNPPEPVMPGAEAPKPTDEAAKAEKKKKAEAVREELVKGADFAVVAKANSDCPSKSKGGDLGRVTKGQTVPEFEKAVFAQEINAIGQVVETKFGYHVIQVLGRREAGLLPFEEVKTEITDYLSSNKRRQVVTDYVEKLKAGAKVEYAK